MPSAAQGFGDVRIGRVVLNLHLGSILKGLADSLAQFSVLLRHISPGVFFVLMLVLVYLGMAIGARRGKRRDAQSAHAGRGLGPAARGAVLVSVLLLLWTGFLALQCVRHRSQLEAAEAGALQTAWQQGASLGEPLRSEEQRLLRAYVPVRLDFVHAGASASAIDANLDAATALQGHMWKAATDSAMRQPDPATVRFLDKLDLAIADAVMRTAAYEQRASGVAWTLLLVAAFVAAVLAGRAPAAKGFGPRVLCCGIAAALLTLVWAFDSPRAGWTQAKQPHMERLAVQVAAPASGSPERE